MDSLVPPPPAGDPDISGPPPPAPPAGDPEMSNTPSPAPSAPADSADPPPPGLTLGTAKLPASTELLAYYRQRIQEFEAERAEFIKRTSEIEVSHEEVHRTQWELRVRHEEIAELQRALSDANVYLFDEREQVLKLQAENDQLKIQELEDRRRIQHLLALTQPVSQEVTFFRDCRPAKMTRFPVESSADGLRSQADTYRSGAVSGNSGSASQSGVGGSGASRAAAQGSISGRASRRSVNTSTASSRGRSTFGSSRRGGNTSTSSASSSASRTAATQPYKSRVLRTIYLPSEKADTLLLTVESLQKQLSAVKELEAGRNAALLEDRRKRNDEERARAVADREKIERLEETIRKTEGKTRQVTKTYLEQRHEAKVAGRVAKEEIEMLRTQNQRLIEQLQTERRRFAVEMQAVRNAAEQEAKVYTEQFRREALAREEDLSVLKEQYAEVQRLSQAKITDLETRLTQLSKKHRQLEQRRSMDFEGFNNDVVILRKQMRRLEGVAIPPSRAALGARGRGGKKARQRRLGNGNSRSTSRADMTFGSTSAIQSFVSTDGLSKLTGRDAVQPERLEADLRHLRARIADIEGQIDGYEKPESA